MLKSISMISSAWLFALLGTYALALPQTGRPIPRKFDEQAPAQQAEIAGMARFTIGDNISDNDDFLIVVNEFKGRRIVRQSVCYNFREDPRFFGFNARCYDMSDYDVVSGTPETMTNDQFYLLRDRLEKMFKDGDRLKQTMTVHSYEVVDSVPYSVFFGGKGWASDRINIGDGYWSSVDSQTRPDDRSVISWKPPYEMSRAIRPYHWDEPKQIDKSKTG